MICDCGETPIKNEALGKEFWYCRNCKTEVSEDENYCESEDDFNLDPDFSEALRRLSEQLTFEFNSGRPDDVKKS